MISLKQSYGDLDLELQELKRQKEEKEEQCQDLIQLANSLLSQKNSFDLVKKSTRIGTLFHKFTNLKLETEQLNTIRNNNKAFDSDRDHKHKTKAALISEKFTERIGNISLQIRSE